MQLRGQCRSTHERDLHQKISSTSKDSTKGLNFFLRRKQTLKIRSFKCRQLQRTKYYQRNGRSKTKNKNSDQQRIKLIRPTGKKLDQHESEQKKMKKGGSHCRRVSSGSKAPPHLTTLILRKTRKQGFFFELQLTRVLQRRGGVAKRSTRRASLFLITFMT